MILVIGDSCTNVEIIYNNDSQKLKDLENFLLYDNYLFMRTVF